MKLRSFLPALLLAAVLVMAFAPLPGAHADVPAEINPEQALILGLVASGVVFVLNLYFKAQNKKLPREVLTVLVYAISVGLAWIWSAPSLPTLPTGTDPAEISQAYVAFAITLLNQGALVLGFATMLYNWLLKRIDEKYISKA
jgi:hypothetical protein